MKIGLQQQQLMKVSNIQKITSEDVSTTDFFVVASTVKITLNYVHTLANDLEVKKVVCLLDFYMKTYFSDSF